MPREGKYRVVTGNAAGDLSTSTAVLAAITGKTLSVKTGTITNNDAALQTVTIEKADGTDLIGPLQIQAGATIPLPDYAPGSFAGDSGAAIHAKASTAENVSVTLEGYVLGGAI
jgi:hypothetical protein